MFKLLLKVLTIVMSINRQLSRIEEELIIQRLLLEAIVANTTPPPLAAHILFMVSLGDRYFEGVDQMKQIIKATEEFDVSLAFQDSLGNPAQVEGVPTWENSNETAIMLTVAENGLSATVSAIGTPGTGQISVTADADLGEGTTNIVGTLDVEVLSGEATVIQLNPSPVREKT